MIVSLTAALLTCNPSPCIVKHVRHFSVPPSSAIMSGPTLTRRGNDYVISRDPGGATDLYRQRYASLGRARVVVDGNCASACTLILSNPRACATPNASFSFHESFFVDISANRKLGRDDRGTQRVFNSYPAHVKAWINANGGLTSRTISAPGQSLLRPCR